MRKNISVAVRTELLKLKGHIPVLIKEQMHKYDERKPVNLNEKIIPLNKTKYSRQAIADHKFELNKGETLDVEKEIAKLNRNMSVVTALLVEMSHRTGKKKQETPNNKGKERSTLERVDL